MFPAAPVMVTVTGFFMTSSGAKTRNGSGNRRGGVALWPNHQAAARAIGAADIDIVGVGVAKAAVFGVGFDVAAGAAQRGDVGEPYFRRTRAGQIAAVELRLAIER